MGLKLREENKKSEKKNICKQFKEIIQSYCWYCWCGLIPEKKKMTYKKINCSKCWEFKEVI